MGRVCHVNEDRRRVLFELQDGRYAKVSATAPIDVSIGDACLINDGTLEPVAKDLWPDETWVGVVKIKLSHKTVIDASGRWRQVPTNRAVAYAVGNTVEVRDSLGVVEVLAKQPIKLVDFGELDESVIKPGRGGGPQRHGIGPATVVMALARAGFRGAINPLCLQPVRPHLDPCGNKALLTCN